MESASLLSRESTTLSLAKPQNGHFMVMKERLIVAGENQHSAFSQGMTLQISLTPPNRCLADCRVPSAILPRSLPEPCSVSTALEWTAVPDALALGPKESRS